VGANYTWLAVADDDGAFLNWLPLVPIAMEKAASAGRS
jgi:hypothetical protein